METQITDALNWRYATKKFDPNRKLTDEQLHPILEAVRLSASSFGLQPWHFFVVSNQELKLELQKAAYGQAQLANSSHIIVFAQKLNVHAATEEYIASTARNAGAPVEQFEGMKQYLSSALSAKSDEDAKIWMSRQVYIALGSLLETAALLHVDVCPMEGFDSAQFDELLGLKEKGLTSLEIATLGYRAEDDSAANQPKNRFSEEEAFTFLK